MQSSTFIYIGVELSGSRKGFTCAVLDKALHILFQGTVSPLEWLAILDGSKTIVTAVDSPLAMNGGFMADGEYRTQMNITAQGVRIKDMRVCEYFLISRGLNSIRTPLDVGKFPISLQRSLKFASELGMNGFQFWPSSGASRQMLETQADACFWSMLGVKPFPVQSLEGRIQRQLALQSKGLALPDAMEFFEEITRHRLLSGKLPDEKILTPANLNALMAAYTAWVAGNRPGEYSCIGEPDEGVIVLPVAKLPEITHE